MEVQANFITKDSIKDKAAAALGLGAQSAFDVVKREDFKSEAEYIRALAETSKALESPEYQRARRRAAEEELRRKERETREKQREEFRRIRAGIKLTPHEQQQIDTKAAEMARADFAAGRIGASALGATIERYAAELEGKEIDAQASAQQFNAFIRDAMQRK